MDQHKVVTFQDAAGTQRIYVFQIGRNDRLYLNYWDGGPWKWAYQGIPTDDSLFSEPTAITYQDATGNQRIYAFVRGARTQKLYVNYWDGGGWRWADQGRPPGTFVSRKPSAITYLDSANKRRIYVFVQGTDARLHVNYWVDGQGWRWSDRGVPSGIPLSSLCSPAAITYRDTGKQRIYAFVVGTTGRLYVHYWNGSRWRWSDRGVPPGVSISQDVTPTVITYRDKAGNQRIYAFVRGNDNHLYVHYWNGSRWRWADQGMPHGGMSDRIPAAAVAYLDATDRQRIYVFVRGGDGHLHVNYWIDGQGWRWADQDAPPGTAVSAARTRGWPAAITYVDSANRRRIYAFVRGGDGHLHVNYWVDGQGWRWADQGTAETGFPCVRIHVKVLTNPNISINTMLNAMEQVFASAGIFVEVISWETLNLPVLNDLDVGGCAGATTNEQNQLFTNRNFAGAKDIVVYFVRSTVPVLNGCALFPAGSPGVVVAQGATIWTLAHEVGHVLGLNHVNNNDRLMTGNGTTNITNPPPDLVSNEVQTMLASTFSLQC